MRTYFDHLDTPEKAYWFGYLAADGWITINPTRRAHRIGIEVDVKDAGHIQLLADELGARVRQRTRIGVTGKSQTSVSFTINSVHMCKALLRHGLSPGKSSTLDFSGILDAVPDPLVSHFARGLFDGDGWAFVVPERADAVTIGFCGNRRLMMRIRSLLVEELGVFSASVITPRGSAHFGKVKWSSRRDVEAIGRWLYADATVALERKRRIVNGLEPAATHCEHCGAELDGQQERWCSPRCHRLHWRVSEDQESFNLEIASG